MEQVWQHRLIANRLCGKALEEIYKSIPPRHKAGQDPHFIAQYDM